MTASGAEQRRAPRTIVDVEAVLQLYGYHPCYGVIQDLSIVGSLFVPEKPFSVPSDGEGRLRFGLPTAEEWIEPHIQVRRTTTFARAGGEQGLAIGLEFSGLGASHERAIAAGSLEWSSHRVREYQLSARCFVQGVGKQRQFSRFGRLTRGTRGYVRLAVPSIGELGRGIRLKLKVATAWVTAEIEVVRQEQSGVELELRLAGWGRDFFLHEARRESLASPAPAAPPQM